MYFVVGEESGDALGASLIETFEDIGYPIHPIGLAGLRMQKRGMTSLFDISDISVMGISAVAAQLPKLMNRIGKTVADILDQSPDVLLLIDSPEFSYRVAKRIRKQRPDIKIIKYVAPSVWAWRPGRAKRIRPHIDHIMAILPFEPELMMRLGGPETTYVGHPMASEMPTIDIKKKRKSSKPPKLVILPGSRKGEIKRLMPVLAETLETLKTRGNEFEIILPAVSKFEAEIHETVKNWTYPIKVVTGDEARKEAFANADLAIAASGTVTLELAIYKVPTIAIYKLDGLAMQIRHMLTGWTASLPNLIADYPVFPERFNEYAHPRYIARMVERLVIDGPERQVQLQGLELVCDRLKQDTPGHRIAAEKIIEIAHKKSGT